MRTDYQILDAIADVTVEVAKTTPLKKTLFKLGGIIIGGIATKVYFLPAQRLTEDDSQFYGTLLVVSTIGINVVVNAYYNVIASQEYFDLWNPITKKLIMPLRHLAVLGLSSFASAFCFAFLELENTGIGAYFNFALQSVIYTTQHTIAVKALYDLWPQWPAIKRAEEKFRQRQAKICDRFDAALFNANKGFYRKTLAVENFFIEDELNINYLVNWIEQQSLPEKINSTPSLSFQTFYYSMQILGFLATFIGNIGYHNDTINGFMKFKYFSEYVWIIATVCMIPVYSLGFTATYQNIKKVFELFKGNFNVDDIPLSIKKTPVFSTICGGGLLTWSLFSFCSALKLLQEAIYGGNPDNLPQFSAMDISQIMRWIYDYSTIISTVLFNIFPVPEVLDFLAKKFCLYVSGSQKDKQQIQLLEFLGAMRNRAVKALPPTFVAETKEEKSTNGTSHSIKPPRKDYCKIITNAICGFFWRQSSTASLIDPLIDSASLQV